MYRLPTQFDAIASRQDLAAAGGGSTSTTCSSCIVTLLGTSVLSAVVLGGLQPVLPAADSGAVESGAVDAGIGEQSPASPQAPANAVNPEPPVAGSGRTGRVLLGLFALPLAAIGGGIFMATSSPMFGLFVGVALFVSLYAMVYERMGRSLGRGIGIGVGLLLGLFVVGALEMMVWLGVMK